MENIIKKCLTLANDTDSDSDILNRITKARVKLHKLSNIARKTKLQMYMFMELYKADPELHK